MDQKAFDSPHDLLERIESAMQRIKDGQAPMRIPIDRTDPDVVLAHCSMEIKRLNQRLGEAEMDGRGPEGALRRGGCVLR